MVQVRTYVFLLIGGIVYVNRLSYIFYMVVYTKNGQIPFCIEEMPIGYESYKTIINRYNHQ